MQYPGFFDLSPDQVHRLIYFPFDSTADIIDFNTEISPELLNSAPVVIDILALLQLLEDLKPVKATATGKLPRKLVREFCARTNYQLWGNQAQSESDIPNLVVLRPLLTKCGWMKRRTNTYSLTKKGKKLLEMGISGEQYFQFMKLYKSYFNWGFFDYYPDLSIIQWSTLFSLYMLHQSANTYISEVELAQYFLEAFPVAIAECQNASQYYTPQEVLEEAFSHRFLDKFCIYFGLLESMRSAAPTGGKICLYVKSSVLFKKFLRFP